MTSTSTALDIQTRKVFGVSTALLLAIWIGALGSISSARSYQEQLDQGVKHSHIVTLSDSLNLIVAFALGATWIVTSKWLRMLHDESSARTPGSIRLGRRWTLWCWVVPLVSFWFPKTIVDDLLRERGFDPQSGATRTTVWWLSWVGFNVLFNASTSLGFNADPNTVPIHPSVEIAAACMLTAGFQQWRLLVATLSNSTIPTIIES